MLTIFDRDYSILTKEEVEDWKKITEQEKQGEGGYKISLYTQYPLAVKHHLSLFPNNYLHLGYWRATKKCYAVLDDFEKLLSDTDTAEREILNFIRIKRAYFIVGAILERYDFGHHGAYIFPEFRLGSRHVVDYLLVGDSSEGHKFVFVELEAPRGQIVRKDGSPGAVLRKGQDQLNDWRVWLEPNFALLRDELGSRMLNSSALPKEFVDLDTSRLNYAVVGGRRSDYNDKTYRARRQLEPNRISLLHYDNLIDFTRTRLNNWKSS